MSDRSLFYLSVTSAAIRAAGAFTAAKELALFFVLVKLPCRKKEYGCNNYSYDNSSHITTPFQ